MNTEQYSQSLQTLSSALEASSLKKGVDEVKQTAESLQEGFNTALGIHSIIKSGKIMKIIQQKQTAGQSSSAEANVERSSVVNDSPPLQEAEDSISPLRIRSEPLRPTTVDDPADLSRGYNDEFEAEQPRVLYQETSTTTPGGSQTTIRTAGEAGDGDVDAALSSAGNEVDNALDDTTLASMAGDENPLGLIVTAVLGLASLGADIADAIEGAKSSPTLQAGAQIGV